MTLDWHELDGGLLMASGREHAYLIVGDRDGVALTRWTPRPNETGSEVARQAALNTIAIPGTHGTGDRAVYIARLQAMAGEFERGRDVFAQPRWQQPDERT
jgi:hypothetical protein